MKYIKSFDSNYKKISEGWFSKKTNIEKVQEEELNIDDIYKIKDKLKSNLNKFDKYKDAYFHYFKLDENKKEKFFDLSLKYLTEIPVDIYKYTLLYKKFPNKINKEYINNIKVDIFGLFHGIRTNDERNLKMCKKLVESVYFLNRISYLLDGDKERFLIKKKKISNSITIYDVIDKMVDTTEKYNL